MTHYIVISPECYEVIDIGLEDGTRPLEYFRYSCSVDAKNKRDAKIKALRHPNMEDWVQEQRDNRANPFVGLTVEIPMCEHGICFCDICCHDNDDFPCPECFDAGARGVLDNGVWHEYP
jgi:hypothetical protein